MMSNSENSFQLKHTQIQSGSSSGKYKNWREKHILHLRAQPPLMQYQIVKTQLPALHLHLMLSLSHLGNNHTRGQLNLVQCIYSADHDPMILSPKNIGMKRHRKYILIKACREKLS